MNLSTRLLEFAAARDPKIDAEFSREAAELARKAAELELSVRALEALAALLPDHDPLRVGVRRYGQHVVAWIDTPSGAREGSGQALVDALLSAAAAGPAARRAAKDPRQSGL
jgi:hypothetical protein